MTVGEVFTIAAALIVVGGLIARQEAHAREIERLRQWRHKIGENPNSAWAEVVKLLDERLKELEKRRR